MSSIHPLAEVGAGAEIGAGVSVGPFCVVGESVRLENNVILHSHVVVTGNTIVGEGTVIFPFAVLGHAPQDLKYAGEESFLVIGRNNKVREHATLHLGTSGGGMETRIGDNNLLMVGCHVAHDCQIGNSIILANNATLGGHVRIDDYAIVGGLATVHQHCRIGTHAMIGGFSGVERDVIPYGLVQGGRAWLHGTNIVGLRRRKFTPEEIKAVRGAIDLLVSGSSMSEDRIEDIRERFGSEGAMSDLLSFLKGETSRQYVGARLS